MYRNFRFHFVLFVFALILSLGSYNQAIASHAVGIDLSYVCIGGNRYEVTLNFYRDCSGISAPTSPILNYSGCGRSGSLSLSRISYTQVPAICPAQQNQTTCNGGNIPGVQQYVYKGLLTVPANCPNFVISYSLCCRNSSITNLQSPGSQNMYAEAVINHSRGYCNNSPVFTTLPVPYICAGEPTNYNHGAVDIDGDGLVYSLVDPLDGRNAPIGHTGGTTATRPIRTTGPFQFNSATGQMSFTPNGTQNAVVTILVEEFRNGVMVGSTMRDIQVLVLNCNNNSPTATGINGTTNYSVTACSGSPICFDIYTDDLNGDNITMTYNNGVPNGVFTVSGPANNPVGNFCWNPNGFSPGQYQFVVTVEDDACPIQGRSIQAYNINLIGGNFTVSAQGSDLTCPGDNNGTATATLNGGDPPFTINWNSTPPQNTLNANNLTAGTYTIEVSDSGGCTASATAVVTQPDPFEFQFTNTSAVCNGEDNGTITLNVTGGNPGPYTYSWSEPGVGSVTFLDSLSAGAYLVTVTDAAGCVADSHTFVFQPGPLVINLEASSTVDYNGSDISCVGAADGEVAVYATGGTQPYIYEWSANANSQTTDTISNLQAGTYFVTVSDSNGCNTGTFISISDPPQIYTSIEVATDYNNQDISCYGFADGAAVALPVGGTPPYTYQWDANAGSQTNDTAFGLVEGVYNVTVYDANLCPVDTFIELNNPDSLSIDVVSISNFNGYEVACNGTNEGVAIANTNGGTGLRSILWSNGTTTELASNLIAGTYTVTVSDANGCFVEGTIVMNEPPALNLALSITSDYNGFDVSCFGSDDGEVTATVSGGVPGYLYSWFPNQSETDSIANNLEANTWYRVVVSDANECNIIDSILLTQPDSILLNPQVVSNYSGYDISCYNGSDGIASVSGIGGTGVYTFEWEDGQNNSQASNLSAGIWAVTATDQNGCIQDTSILLTHPDSIVVDLSITSDYNGSNISCFEAADGSLLADASGGVGPYQYTWGSNVPSPNQAAANSLSEDWYLVTVLDQNSCIVIDSIFLDDPEPVVASARGIDVICAGDVNGRGFANAIGGVSGYSYQWNDPNGQIAANASGLAAGTYTVTVTDLNGCTDDTTVYIGEPDSLLLDGFKIDPTCYGFDDGTARVDVLGGVPPYLYEWNDLDSRTSSEIDALFADSYRVVVTDSTGCVRTVEVVLNNPPQVEIDAIATPAQILFGQRTQINTLVTNNIITPNSGETYEWSPFEGLYCVNCPNPGAAPERTTTYTVNYTDSRGCKTSDEVTIEVDIYNRILYIPNAFTPNGDDNNDKFYVQAEGVEEIVFKIFDRWGEQLFETNDLDIGWDGKHNGEELKPGVFVYYAKIVYSDGFEEEKKGSITLIR